MKNQTMKERNPSKRHKIEKMKKNMSILHYIWATVKIFSSELATSPVPTGLKPRDQQQRKRE